MEGSEQQGEECPEYLFDYLPPEIVSHILSFLPTIEDRKAASLVCSNWLKAYQCPEIGKKEVLVITSPEIVDELYALHNSTRAYTNVCVRGIDIDRTEKKFWKRIAPFLRSLSLNSCHIREKTFVKILEMCGELESLSVQDCRDLFISGELFQRARDRELLEIILSRLKSLSLGYNRYLSDSLFTRFTSICRHIQELLLPGCHISFHSSLYRRFYRNGHQERSDNIFTFNIILKYIKDTAFRLKVLSFSETLIDGESLNALARTPNLAIEKLYLRGCVQVTSESLVTLSEYQSFLTHLDIAFCPRITDMALTTICNRLTGLKFLSVQGCRNITELGVSELWRLTQIIRLNISECEKINDAGILKGLGTRQNDTLEELCMSRLPNISDNSLSQIMKFLPNLRHLDLGYCCTAITDKAVQSIFLHTKRLKTLTLITCERLTDRGITGIATELSGADSKEASPRHTTTTRDDSCSAAADPDREGTEQLSADIAPGPEVRGSSLRHLKILQNLTLSGCNHITDFSIKYGLKINDLKSLDLSSCQNITAEGLSYISQYNKSLETLNLDNCNNVDDEGVGHILKNLKRLKSLSLGSRKITDRILEFLRLRTSNLSYLDVRHCNQISGATVNEIIASCPGLQVVHFPNEANDFQSAAPPPPAAGDSP